MARFILLRRIVVLCAFAVWCGMAQAWPDRPVALVVPFAAGGPTDTIARIVAERISRGMGQPVVVENIAGAGGTIANARVIKAAPDGYTMMIGHVGTHVLAQAVQGLAVDYLSDFDPVALIATNPEVILSRNGVPARNLQELLDWVRANPGKVSFGSGGAGTPSHVMAAQFSTLVAPLNILHYRGSGPAMLDVVAGHVDLSFEQAATGLAFVRSGQVRAYAITSKSRIASSPDIPTVDEAGLPGFYMSVWHAIWVPRGTPRDVVNRLNGALREALADPVVRKRFAEMGQEIPSVEQQTPEALRAFHKSEIDKWHPIVKAANIRAN